MSISKEEYLKIIEELPDQYGDDDEDYIIPEDAWLPAESDTKQRMKSAEKNIVIDILDFKKAKVQEALYQYMNFKIGSFLLRIEEYHGVHYKDGSGADLTLDISIWQHQDETTSGLPCNMDIHMDFHNDDRFIKKPWLNYFDSKGHAHNIPIETTANIIRWLQVIQKIPAFL